MKTIRMAALAATMLCGLTGVAKAQEAAEPFTITGSASLVSDYRFRGVSQSNEDLAVQGSINLNTDMGLYIGTWASSIELPGAGSTEVDIYGGYKFDLGGAALDAGVLYYYYPGADFASDFAEVYASVSGAFGPATAKVGLYYAPDQNAIGSEDNWYWYGDLSGAIPETPVTLKAHLGYSTGDSFLTLGEDNYLDWMVGADFTYKNLTLGVSYVDTDLNATSFVPGGRNVVDEAVVFSLTAAF